MRKFEGNSFRITGNTNFKKKFTALYRNLSGEIQLWKSKLQLKFAYTLPALKLLFLDRSLNDCFEWTLRNKIIHTEAIFGKIYLKTQMFVYSNEIRLFQRLNPTKIFKLCDENFTTKLSRIWECFLKYLLEFSISVAYPVQRTRDVVHWRSGSVNHSIKFNSTSWLNSI